MKGREGREE